MQLATVDTGDAVTTDDKGWRVYVADEKEAIQMENLTDLNRFSLSI